MAITSKPAHSRYCVFCSRVVKPR